MGKRCRFLSVNVTGGHDVVAHARLCPTCALYKQCCLFTYRLENLRSAVPTPICGDAVTDMYPFLGVRARHNDPDY